MQNNSTVANIVVLNLSLFRYEYYVGKEKRNNDNKIHKQIKIIIKK